MKTKLTDAVLTLAGAAALWFTGWAGLWIITGIMNLLGL